MVYRLHVQGVKGSDGTRKRDLKIVRIGQPGGANGTPSRRGGLASSQRHGMSLSSSRMASQSSNASSSSSNREKITTEAPSCVDILATAEKFSLDSLVEEKK